ncbi:unnamed protein product, partial [Polarella glacialis]
MRCSSPLLALSRLEGWGGRMPSSQWRLCLSNERRWKCKQMLKALARAKEGAARQQRALIQHNIVDRQHRGGGCDPVVVAAAGDVLEQPLVWSSPAPLESQRPLLHPPFAN